MRRSRAWTYQRAAQMSRGPHLLTLALGLLVALLYLTGCAGLDERDQKIVSGMAIGGTLACWPGAIIGAGVGYIIGHDGEDKP